MPKNPLFYCNVIASAASRSPLLGVALLHLRRASRFSLEAPAFRNEKWFLGMLWCREAILVNRC